MPIDVEASVPPHQADEPWRVDVPSRALPTKVVPPAADVEPQLVSPVSRLAPTCSPVSPMPGRYDFEDVRITPKPVQQPIPTYVGSFSKPSIELAARLGYGVIVAPLAAAITFGGLRQAASIIRA